MTQNYGHIIGPPTITWRRSTDISLDHQLPHDSELRTYHCTTTYHMTQNYGHIIGPPTTTWLRSTTYHWTTNYHVTQIYRHIIGPPTTTWLRTTDTSLYHQLPHDSELRTYHCTTNYHMTQIYNISLDHQLSRDWSTDISLYHQLPHDSDLRHIIGPPTTFCSRRERSTLAQLRSGHCRLLGSYKSRIKKDASHNVCSDCGTSPRISSLARLTRLLWYRQIYGTDRQTSSGNSTISRRETQTEMNMDWKANNNNNNNNNHQLPHDSDLRHIIGPPTITWLIYGHMIGPPTTTWLLTSGNHCSINFHVTDLRSHHWSVNYHVILIYGNIIGASQ